MSESEEQVLARHKKEIRDLVATTTGLKKQATKKNRKDVNKRVQEMEVALQEKHKAEISVLHSVLAGGDLETPEDVEASAPIANDEDDELTPDKLLAQLELDTQAQETQYVEVSRDENKKGPKRNRQKERLARRDAAINEMKTQAAKEAEQQPDFRAMELENIEMLCNAAKLSQFDIKPDGHCLFASIADQLKLRHSLDTTVAELRKRAADHIRKDPNTYSPFLFDEETLTIKDITSYTEEIEKTALWGGDMEILALSKEFNCPIYVLMSGRAPLRMNEEGQEPELKLCYYKHSYGLGEHYNSLHDAKSAISA